MRYVIAAVAQHQLMMRKLHPVRVLRVCCALILTLPLAAFLIGFVPSSLFKSGKIRSREQKTLDYMSQHMNVYYRLLGNKNDQFVVDITLTNTGTGVISGGNWTLYFHHLRFLDSYSFNHGKQFAHGVDIFKLYHVNSYLFKLKPTHRFPNLTKDEFVTFHITGNGWIAGRSDVYPNWYVNFDRIQNSEPRVIKSTMSDNVDFVGPFDTKYKWKRAEGDLYNPYTPEERYMKNNLHEKRADPTRLIIPKPVKTSITEHKSVTVTKSWLILHEETVSNEAGILSAKVHLKTKTINSGSSYENANSIILKVDASILSGYGEVAGEGYELLVDVDKKCISIRGRSPAGVFYGVQSLLQMVDAHVDLPAIFPAVHILDYPRLPYRGLMLDVARNFHNMWSVMQLIDLMAQYKMNRLHFHLADDEGWRLEIPGLPELTEVGGQRCHDPRELVCLMPMHGSGPYNNTSGSGFFTKTDYREILAYAAQRHVVIIPEFDMPGHSHAAIKSMESRYYRLADAGQLQEAHRYLLSDLQDRSQYFSGQFFTDSALNPCVESTFNFVEHVMGEVKKLHEDIQPLTVYHFGGDEVPQSSLTDSPACRTFQKQFPQWDSPKKLKTYFVKRVAEIAKRLGVGLQGWEDGYSTDRGDHMTLEELGLTDVYSNAWYHIWCAGNEGDVYGSANAGYKVVLSSSSHLYFDNPQEPDPDDWGLTWATRYVDTKRTFGYQPDSFYNNIDFGYFGDRQSKETCCSTAATCVPLRKPENIIGISGSLWTEEVRTKSRLDQMLWPRMFALAERAWHKAEWEELKGTDQSEARARDWAEFANLIGRRHMPRLDQLGVEYYIPPPGVVAQNGILYTNSMFPGLINQWSKDTSVWYDIQPDTKVSGKVHFSTLSSTGDRRSRIITYHIPHNV